MAKKSKKKKVEAEWVPVYDYEGLYEINRDGQVRNVNTGRMIKAWVSDTGYVCVNLRKDKKAKPKKLHRLLMLSFIGPIEGKPVVNHIDGNKLNNDLSNLEWCTSSENNVHAIKTHLRSYDKIKREYHVQIEDLDFVALGAKAAAEKLHNEGYFIQITTDNLKAAIVRCAIQHILYDGILKVEATDDPYDDPKEYKKCGRKGRLIQAVIGTKRITCKGPAKLVDELQSMGYWKGLERKSLIKLVSEAALANRNCHGISVRYL